jgi:hypothetical protein
MKVTKRDIADISLVWIAFHFIPYLFNYAIYVLVYLSQPDPPNTLFTAAANSKWFQFYASVGQFGIMAAFFWFLLFKRNLILDLLFPGSEDKALEIAGDSTEKLTDYSFWITIFGLFTAIYSGIKFLSGIPRCIDNSIDVFFQNVWHNESVDILALGLAAVVIWKAKSIATMLNHTKTIDAAKSNQ